MMNLLPFDDSQLAKLNITLVKLYLCDRFMFD